MELELSPAEIKKVAKQLKAVALDRQPQEGGFLPILAAAGAAGLTALVAEIGKLIAPLIVDKVKKMTGNGLKLSGSGMMLAGPQAKRVPKARAVVVEHAALVETPARKPRQKKQQPVIEPPPS